jgi:hypothetical protein
MASHAMLSLVDGATDQRRADRVRLLLSARLITTTDEFPVMLRDISLSGAMVEASRLPAAGLDLLLRRGPLDIFAHLVWVSGNRAGLEFETPLAMQEFVTQFPRTTWAPGQSGVVGQDQAAVRRGGEAGLGRISEPHARRV